MPRTPSPLRYPGGKTKILPIVSGIVAHNQLTEVQYLEPFAGGSGLALSLLFNDIVKEIHLNDIDRSIYTFWDAVLNCTDRFIERIKNTPVTVDEWHQQRQVQNSKDSADNLDLGFSSFYLNRTNRSGIIQKAGIIGGFEQDGQYTLDCRFNKDGLIEKIRKIADSKENIHIYNLDAVEFIERLDRELKENVLYYIDPPYYSKGHTLYTNYFQHEDHRILAEKILSIEHPWILTYDISKSITDLYKSKCHYKLDLNYSLARKRTGSEILILSDNLSPPQKMKIFSTEDCAESTEPARLEQSGSSPQVVSAM